MAKFFAKANRPWLVGILFALTLPTSAEIYLRHKGELPRRDGGAPTLRNEPSEHDERLLINRRLLHPRLGWVNPIGKVPAQEGCPEDSTVWTNGQRASRPTSAEKAGAHKRVALIGCSFTFGTGVRDSETFAWVLNQRFPNITFDNLGVEGYGTCQSLLHMLQEDENQHKHYDAYIYSAIFDHYFRNISDHPLVTGDGFIYIYPGFRPGHIEDARLQESNWYGERSAAFIFYLHKLDLWLRMERNSFWREHIPYEWQPSTFSLANDTISAMNEYAHSHGSQFACAIFDAPTWERLNPPLQEAGIATIEAILMGQDHPECFNQVEGRAQHPNAAGHRFFAERIGTWIANNPQLQ